MQQTRCNVRRAEKGNVASEEEVDVMIKNLKEEGRKSRRKEQDRWIGQESFKEKWANRESPKIGATSTSLNTCD